MSETYPQMEDLRTGLEVAVIGMACRFPGAKNIEQFWNNLKEGVTSIRFFSDEELREAGVAADQLADPNYVKAKGYLEDTEYFDYSFFGYTPLEGDVMNPQIRIFHECAWEALENAGYEPGAYSGLISLYAGLTPNLSWDIGNMLGGGSGAEAMAASNLNSNSFATLIAYRLNLRGAAVTVQTACSTSMVAIHSACRSLLNGECDMALAGGVTVSVPAKSGYGYQEGMIMSPDGHCRAFDAEARGTVSGNGCGLVVLKLLEDAIEDGDYIHAVVKGSALNNDGNRKVGYTAPGVEGQSGVIRSAQEMAEVEPETITYIEAHGTGTVLGDPIEIEALNQAFNTDKKQYCRIGSVKTNMGHLDSASGVAGFIKTVLALEHKQIPPSLDYKAPNPKIDFENSPFFVNTELTDWKHLPGVPLRAGISSFGIGGTNAHAVLEEAPPRPDAPPMETGAEKERLLVVSARTTAALDQATANLAAHLEENRDLPLDDVAYTMQKGRKAHPRRRFVLCSSIAEGAELLKAAAEGVLPEEEPDRIRTRTVPKGEHPAVFMFPGQGAQYVNMGLDLYRDERVFREEMDRCFGILAPLMGKDIKTLLYPGEAGQEVSDSAAEAVNQTEITQPVIFAFEYALAKLLISWGIVPQSMIGHSIGEYTAACLAGVFSLEDALKIVALRGKLMQALPTGSMLGVPMSEKALTPLLEHSGRALSLAAVNSPSGCVVSGRDDAIEAFAAVLKEKGHESRALHTSHAFHSEMMAPCLEEFKAAFGGIKMEKPRIPFISNVTGKWITFDEAADRGYWATHLRQAVRFADGLSVLLEDPGAVFVEVGPGRVLSTFLRQQQEEGGEQPAVNLVRHPKESAPDRRFLLKQVGQLWLSGVNVNWRSFYGDERPNRVPLPTYPFEKQECGMGVDFSKLDLGTFGGGGMGRKEDIGEWFYAPLWQRAPLLPVESEEEKTDKPEHWLLFLDAEGVGRFLAERLEQDNRQVTTVTPGEVFREVAAGQYELNPGQAGDYELLFKGLKGAGGSPGRVVHLWHVTGRPKEPLSPEMADEALQMGYYSILEIVKSITNVGLEGDIEITAVTDYLHDVVGDDGLCPEKAPLLGALQVIPMEYPNLTCRTIDICLQPSKQTPEKNNVSESPKPAMSPKAVQYGGPGGASPWRSPRRGPRRAPGGRRRQIE